jgi:hypothetical protein
MKFAYDVYAETNPAFCTYALVAFVKAYLSINASGPELPIAYLALPVALSGDLAEAFGGTNKNTGLLEWLERSPQVQVGFTDRVNASMEIVTEAIRFACFTGVLSMEESARLQLGEKKLKKSAASTLDDGASRVIKHAERLGYWLAMAGSTRSIFDIMGLTV